MKEAFVPKRFGSDALQMIATITGILDEYSGQGYDLSLRQLYYQLVARNVIPNTEKSYKNVGCLVSDARLAGLIDWDMIKDRGREMIANPHWDDPANFIEVVAPQYRFDLWADQPNYVEVMVEKQALEGVLQPVCRDLDIPFTANKGYLGDHDPSGIDMSRDVLDRLDLFLKISLGRAEDGGIDVKRVALNMDQIKTLKPPENPAKVTDSRAASYIRRFGSSSWELDAIEPRQLANLVTQAVTGLMDLPLFKRNKKKQEDGRKSLLAFAKTYLK